MTSYPAPYSLILIAITLKPRDIEIARLLGWYRIPLRKAPKIIEVDYLAFYQTAAFGREHRWRIEYFAEVRGHELVSRMELFRDQPEHPHANEEYFKLIIGPLQHLPRPILADKWRRLTFLYTTGELLQSAMILNDLVVSEEDRGGLWRTLRERAIQSTRYDAIELPLNNLDPAILAMLGDLSHPNKDNRTSNSK
jgi:hypothetical protein